MAYAQLDVQYQGLALLDSGLCSDYNGLGYPNVLSGTCLNTFGLLWANQDSWTKSSEFVGITTIWTIEYLPS